MRGLAILAILCAAGLGGCLSDGPGAPVETPPDPSPTLPVIQDDGTLTMDVPVDVFLVGFDAGTQAALQTELEPMDVAHEVYGFARTVYLGDEDAPDAVANPMQPRAVYRVHAAAADTAERLASHLRDRKADGMLDANAAETWLWDELGRQGFDLSADRPALVFVHLGEVGHSYRITYETGHVDAVRVYGERLPLLVMDVSAAPDPWIGEREAYNSPVRRAGPEAVEMLAEAARAATHFRLLQGPLYPPTLRMCHTVTLVTAVRGSALTETVPGYRSVEEYVQPENLTMAWEHLLGEGRVHVDHVIVRLPADDPGLDAVLRTGDLESLRLWMDENWQTYWVPHTGCEAYLSLFLYGDAGDSGVSGIAMYDVRDDRRLSLSSFNDLDRMREDGAGAFAPVFHVPDDARYESDWLDFLYTHETGHLFGQRHPHDVSLVGGGDFDPTYSSIWSAMSYQEDGKLPQFGAVDVANQARNRAGFLLQAVRAQDAEDPRIEEALGHMARYEWHAAATVLEPAIA